MSSLRLSYNPPTVTRISFGMEGSEDLVGGDRSRRINLEFGYVHAKGLLQKLRFQLRGFKGTDGPQHHLPAVQLGRDCFR